MSDTIAAKIAKLLAKAESTTNEHEADAFTSKAQELMMRHAIDAAMIEGLTGERKEKIENIDFDIDNVVGKLDIATMGYQIARVFGCEAYLSHGQTHINIIGYPSDILAAITLWFSLRTQLDSAIARARDNGEHLNAAGNATHQRTFKAAFTRAYRVRVVERIRARYAEAVEEAGPGVGIVLRDRKRAVDDFMATISGLRSTKLSTVNNGVGIAAGRNAADRANISNGNNGLRAAKQLGA